MADTGCALLCKASSPQMHCAVNTGACPTACCQPSQLVTRYQAYYGVRLQHMLSCTAPISTMIDDQCVILCLASSFLHSAGGELG